MVKWKIRRRSYFVPPLIYFIPPLSLRFLPPFSPLSFFSFFFLHRLRRFSSFFIRSLENAAQTERTNPPGIVRLGTISLVLNSTQASPLNEIQGCFFLRSTASQAERKKTRATRAFGRLWLTRLPIFFPFYRLISPRNFWKILKSRPVFFPRRIQKLANIRPDHWKFFYICGENMNFEEDPKFQYGLFSLLRRTSRRTSGEASSFSIFFLSPPQDPSFALIMPEIRHSAPGYSPLLPPNKRAIFPLPPGKNSLSARIFIRPLIEIRFSRVERRTPPRSPWSQ